MTSYVNPATGTQSWRVSGTKRDGTRVRENYVDPKDAQFRQVDLEGEFLARQTDTALRATRLTDTQVQIAELCFAKLTDDADLIRAVDQWRLGGKQNVVAESPLMDDAIEQYKTWLAASDFRDATKRHWKIRMNVFKNSVRNQKVSEFMVEDLEAYLATRNTSQVGKDTDRRAVSRFFSWCIEKKWTTINPARKQTRTRKPEVHPPSVLNVKQCRALLRASERFGLAPYVAVCLFGGVRPFEASRLTWASVNLKDREIRLEANQTKTRRPRVVAICDALFAWLDAHKGTAFYPSNWRKKFDAVKRKAKLTTWPPDVMRHTAASHYFRHTGSYGKTAEQFGNSESIIKNHYQGRVSSEETKKFYAMRPQKGSNAKKQKPATHRTSGEGSHRGTTRIDLALRDAA